MPRLQIVLSAIFTAVAALLIAQYYPVFQPILAIFHSTSSTTTTYCYRNIKTQSATTANAKCFSVDETTGLFTKLYNNVADVPKHHRLYVSNDSVIPGLWDGHGHLLQLGEFLSSVDLFGSLSLDDALKRVDDYVSKHSSANGARGDDELGSKKRWIRGVGWDQAAFGRMPTADDFESIPSLKDKFIMLDRVDVHCIWVSNAVLGLLPSDLPSHIPGGEIITDPGRGVLCDTAMDLVTKLWPRPSEDEQSDFVSAAMRHLNSVGIVGMHDAGVTPATLRLYGRLAMGREWTVRNYAMLECEDRNTFCPHDATAFHNLNVVDRLWVRSVKLFADGALGSWGSAMLEPYSDKPDSVGSLLVNGTVLSELTRQWSGAGYQVNIHAIGDLANRLAIDAFEAVLQRCPHTGTAYQDVDEQAKEAQTERMRKCQQLHRRFRIEHAQIMHPFDQRRLLALGIIPSIQPTHATSDMYYAESRLGPQRVKERAYRMRSFLTAPPNTAAAALMRREEVTAPEQQIVLATMDARTAKSVDQAQAEMGIVVLGSDFPVEPANPFSGVYAAVTRKDTKSGSNAYAYSHNGKEGWHVEESLTLQQALDGFTTAPARAAFLEGKAGIIEVGAFADWVVLDLHRDTALGFEEADGYDGNNGWDGISVKLLGRRAENIVRQTWVGGRNVYDGDTCREPL